MKIFHLSEPKHGWVEVTFGEPPDAFTFTVSDVPNDCLRDLAVATARLLRHSTDETVEFSLEPAFATCELHREADSVRVVVRHPAHADPAFDATHPIRQLAPSIMIFARMSDKTPPGARPALARCPHGSVI